MPQKPSQIVYVAGLSLLLSACGGGSDGGSAGAKTPVSTPNPTIDSGAKDPAPNLPPLNREPVNSTAEISMSQLGNTNHTEGALLGSNAISLARQSCGLGGVAEDSALNAIAINHASYIQYVFANSRPSNFNPHQQAQLPDAQAATSKNNPFFSGLDLSDRLTATNYPRDISTFENISSFTQYHSRGQIASPQNTAQSMVKSLLAAPYHLKSLMSPNIAVTGSSLIPYIPYNTDGNTNRGFIFVNHSAATKATQNKNFGGIFTYPCDNLAGTSTALYHEAPDPFNGGRDLRNNPIGQPIYINVPTAKTIAISNVRFVDVKRNEAIPVQLLDQTSDPYKGSNYAITANEAFILPLTDSLKSCESGQRQGQNCGLYGNSAYEVSFDVMVDNKLLQNKRFTFKTGAVNY